MKPIIKYKNIKVKSCEIKVNEIIKAFHELEKLIGKQKKDYFVFKNTNKTIKI